MIICHPIFTSFWILNDIIDLPPTAIYFRIIQELGLRENHRGKCEGFTEITREGSGVPIPMNAVFALFSETI